ncbi:MULTISPECIES: 16S rRNA (guanine(527)-N(7))-methyltransferase RsmG [Rhodobacterales]|jgi:16S rRNA (guanine527-N7)-methyltransferase|uniref:16S rRNA (guanine(527)-N(7))-methyltransferase RsmG n=1 Tax=Rhodobacterales TaxID=204455 RepID=UPI00237F442A|nr:16S rRNA (guanine(527)-N(7))-methyltransferase RsmG [Phaeobacter gallaeciensis]MDE4098073.1 16S rRNA (guanine(527)-N(7))-methyltransferase RsmG [Phaeobacter gallaeciensis]MDE4106668.1 16S rRNA (guanine(527)-N(7))-methyltransferase RsmG [Phaeobacter gallaeciensis]MDE4111122.1 16S rRNA (guanine(527)-N(7))-methyltransferase RsmG [Phaeobacter gallaeciensis]MDE4115808.1 16S rRNA (guanine(527)-N(7))-methyltransferase RsmG [Phaeobacter gallaeciensis]MDE4120063.1 16S rRNA (guanine(527)-N(7))-methyl
MTTEALLERLNVSRETLNRLKIFEQVLLKWNPKINLVSRNSLDDLWTRHIIDSVQVFRCVSPPNHWVDMGSGGGLPGVIVAIMAAEESPNTKVTLIESDQRKSAFLRTAARECGAKLTVISKRIEQADPQNADVLSARALADLSLLLEFSERHLSPTGTALFPKGANWKKEVDNARQRWRFDFEPITSLTEPDAVVLKIEGVARV